MKHGLFKSVADVLVTNATRPFGRIEIALTREEWVQAIHEWLIEEAKSRRFQPEPPPQHDLTAPIAYETAMGTIVFRMLEDA